MATPERPVKRARQACDQCRRKKTRCPGEKPVCGYCARLGHQCTYTDEGLLRKSIGDSHSFTAPSRPALPLTSDLRDHNGNDTAHRLSELEYKLSEVLVALHENRQRKSPDRGSPVMLPALPRASPISSVHATSAQSLNESVSQDMIQLVAELYLNYCHCQPLPLFDTDQFENRLALREEEVVLAVSANALRFSSTASLQHDYDDVICSYIEKARSLTLQRIKDGPIELSTLQSLCLLSWLDFYNGNTHQASTYVTLAADICKSSKLASNSGINDSLGDEKLRCFWSIILLQRLHPNISGSFYISYDKDGMPPYPTSSARPALARTTDRAVSENRLSDHKDLGIIAYAIQMTEVWYKVVRYAHRRASAGAYPPWSSKSDYAKIIAQQMNDETAMPYSKHRFKPVKLEERSPQEIFQHRSYWGPWLFTQLLYHTTICLLNHPLLLSLRLQHFRVASIPEIWLQHTDDLITQHSQWVVHIIEVLDIKSFKVSDPFLAHCVAIVATIYLQQSFSDDENAHRVKKEKFARCLRFCQKVGEQWVYIKQLARKLQDFERVVSDSYLNSAASQADDKIFIDLTLFWEILESAAISDKPDVNGLKLGPSLSAQARHLNAAEELNARLLPETSRVTAGSPAHGILDQQAYSDAPNAISGTNGQPNIGNDDFNVLAQSYFAQGQDFVGNMDDWWLMEDTNPPAYSVSRINTM